MPPSRVHRGTAGASDTWALFVSDVHLLPAGAPGADERLRCFGDFLDEADDRSERGGPGALYVLGDLFEYWYETGGRPPPGFDAALEVIRGATTPRPPAQPGVTGSRGLRVIAIPGNRDFLLGGVFRRATGAAVATEEVWVDLGRERALLLHGDGLALADRRNLMWRRIRSGPTFRRFARGAPRCLGGPVVGALMKTSRIEKGRKPPSVMAFAEEALRRRVARGADVVVAGHTHEPSDRPVATPRRVASGEEPDATRPRRVASGEEPDATRAGRKGRLVVLGSWESGRGAYAEWDGERLALLR